MTRRIEPAPAQRVRGTRLATALRAGADGEGLAVEPVFAAPRDGPDAFRVRGLSATGFLGDGRPGLAVDLHLHRLAAPDLLEPVVVADRRLHDVRHRGAAVDDDPLAVFRALGAEHRHAARLDGLAHAAGQRSGLAVAGARG